MDENAAKHHLRITLIGAGTIGTSLAALQLERMLSPTQLTVVDIRPDLQEYIDRALRQCLPQNMHHAIAHVNTSSSISEAVKCCDAVHECGPENLAFKCELWKEVEQSAPTDALFWSATSGIPASRQNAFLRDKSRLLVVHPFNPPHILPLLEIVPSPATSGAVTARTIDFWKVQMGRVPILLQREITGFVAGRLAWVLLREAIHLVNEEVTSVEEIDLALQNSMGTRWAYAGPFKSFHAGGGEGGLRGLFENVGATIQGCWDDAGRPRFGDGSGWEDKICSEVAACYWGMDLKERDVANRAVLTAVKLQRPQMSQRERLR